MFVVIGWDLISWIPTFRRLTEFDVAEGMPPDQSLCDLPRETQEIASSGLGKPFVRHPLTNIRRRPFTLMSISPNAMLKFIRSPGNLQKKGRFTQRGLREDSLSFVTLPQQKSKPKEFDAYWTSTHPSETTRSLQSHPITSFIF